MSSGAQTRGQLVAAYDRLKKRVDTIKVTNDTLEDILGVSRAVLEMYPVSSATTSTAAAMPNADEIEALMKSLLPSPVDIYTEVFFRAPLFALVTLYSVADFYGCISAERLVIDALGLSEPDKANKNIRLHVWFADFLNCDREMILSAVEMFKASRGSPDMLRRLAIIPSRDNSLNDREIPSVAGTQTGAGSRSRSGPHDPKAGADDLRDRKNVASVRSPRQEDHRDVVRPTSEVGTQDGNDSRKATNVFQYFKDSKFTGDLSQSIELTIRDYNVCARQHKLTEKQKADFFVNVLADPARTFFFNNARDDMSFDEMARMMVQEYNSDARQLQVQGMLETLRLDKYMSEHDISSHPDGLTKIIDLIERLTPQCQPQFRSDANKINYLRKAVLGFNWALIPIGNVITAKYSFNGFVTALREHLQLENEVSMANPSATGNLRTLPDCTHHQQYGRHPKHVRKHGPPNNRTRQGPRDTPPSSFAESRKRGICHRCRQKWRPGHRCQPGAIRSYVRDRLKNGDSAVHIVSDLVTGLEEEVEEEVNDDNVSSAPSDDDGERNAHFGDMQGELAVFDQLSAAEEPNSIAFIEELDREWFTNHLSSSLTPEAKDPLESPSAF